MGEEVIDAADQVTEMEAVAMQRFEAEQGRVRRLAESMRPYDPTRPINCIECGEDVAPARLEALPHTRRCAECAAEVERANGWGVGR